MLEINVEKGLFSNTNDKGIDFKMKGIGNKMQLFQYFIYHVRILNYQNIFLYLDFICKQKIEKYNLNEKVDFNYFFNCIF